MQSKVFQYITLTFAVLLSASPLCFANNQIDSLQNRLKQTNSPKQKLTILLQLSEAMLLKEDHHCLEYAEEALMLADSINSKIEIAEANYLSGCAWRLCGDNSTSIAKLFASVELFKELSLTDKESQSLCEIGETYRANGNRDLSLEFLKKALTIQQTINDSAMLARTYNRLAASTYELLINAEKFQELVRAGKTNRQALDSALKFMPDFLMNFDSTRFYITQSNRYAKSSIYPNLEISNQILLGATHSAVFDFQKADSILANVLQVTQKERLENDMALVYFNIALLRRSQKRYQEAIESSLMAYNIAQKQNISVYRLINANILGELYQNTGNSQKAIEFMNIARNEVATFYKYDLGLKINALNFQNEIEKRKAELQYQKSRTRNQIIFLLIILALTVVFFSVIYFKNKKLNKLNLQLQRKNNTIEKQNSELSILNAEKDKFFSIVAHDLRGPMGTFVSIADLILEELKRKRIDKVKLLSSNLQITATHLFGLLENLLDWSRIQRNAITYSPQRIKLSKLVEESIAVISDSAKEKDIELVCEVDRYVELTADPHMLQSVIRNIASNAVKFTPQGGRVEISSKFAGLYVDIYISDNGIGMSKEIIENLFDLDSSKSRLGTNYEPSTGLGMVLCKDFIEKMGGNILIESEEGKGSKFTVQIPL